MTSTYAQQQQQQQSHLGGVQQPYGDKRLGAAPSAGSHSHLQTGEIIQVGQGGGGFESAQATHIGSGTSLATATGTGVGMGGSGMHEPKEPSAAMRKLGLTEKDGPPLAATGERGMVHETQRGDGYKEGRMLSQSQHPQSSSGASLLSQQQGQQQQQPHSSLSSNRPTTFLYSGTRLLGNKAQPMQGSQEQTSVTGVQPQSQLHQQQAVQQTQEQPQQSQSLLFDSDRSNHDAPFTQPLQERPFMALQAEDAQLHQQSQQQQPIVQQQPQQSVQQPMQQSMQQPAQQSVQQSTQQPVQQQQHRVPPIQEVMPMRDHKPGHSRAGSIGQQSQLQPQQGLQGQQGVHEQQGLREQHGVSEQQSMHPQTQRVGHDQSYSNARPTEQPTHVQLGQPQVNYTGADHQQMGSSGSGSLENRQIGAGPSESDRIRQQQQPADMRSAQGGQIHSSAAQPQQHQSLAGGETRTSSAGNQVPGLGAPLTVVEIESSSNAPTPSTSISNRPAQQGQVSQQHMQQEHPHHALPKQDIERGQKRQAVVEQQHPRSNEEIDRSSLSQEPVQVQGAKLPSSSTETRGGRTATERPSSSSTSTGAPPQAFSTSELLSILWDMVDLSHSHVDPSTRSSIGRWIDLAPPAERARMGSSHIKKLMREAQKERDSRVAREGEGGNTAATASQDHKELRESDFAFALLALRAQQLSPSSSSLGRTSAAGDSSLDHLYTDSAVLNLLSDLSEVGGWRLSPNWKQSVTRMLDSEHMDQQQRRRIDSHLIKEWLRAADRQAKAGRTAPESNLASLKLSPTSSSFERQSEVLSELDLCAGLLTLPGFQ